MKNERRADDAEPIDLDRLLAEMAEVRVERLAAGRNEEDSAKNEKPVHAVGHEKTNGVHRIDCEENGRLPEDSADSHHRQRREPHQHHWSENGADTGSTAPLKHKEHDQ